MANPLKNLRSLYSSRPTLYGIVIFCASGIIGPWVSFVAIYLQVGWFWPMLIQIPVSLLFLIITILLLVFAGERRRSFTIVAAVTVGVMLLLAALMLGTMSYAMKLQQQQRREIAESYSVTKHFDHDGVSFDYPSAFLDRRGEFVKRNYLVALQCPEDLNRDYFKTLPVLRMSFYRGSRFSSIRNQYPKEKDNLKILKKDEIKLSGHEITGQGSISLRQFYGGGSQYEAKIEFLHLPYTVLLTFNYPAESVEEFENLIGRIISSIRLDPNLSI